MTPPEFYPGATGPTGHFSEGFCLRRVQWLCQARTLLLERNIEAAEALLRKALALDPASSAAHDALAVLLVNEGRTEEGVEHYDRSLRLDPRLFG
ncbi:MAG: tetratricopeptide repeat protein, partial [Pseudomonadota bacterium]|nr:tetratricopeptide repeat protein [Pseudomonadota bacterium]